MRPLDRLRKFLEKNDTDIYIHFNTDPHMSEYVGNYYKGIEYICGFSGSNATIVITKEHAGLWTDGRYFIQAKDEIKNSGFRLYKMGVKGEPSILEFVEKYIKKGEKIGFDYRLITQKEYEKYKKLCASKKVQIKDIRPLDEIWTKRPIKKHTKIWILKKEYSGKSMNAKLNHIRKKLRDNKCDGIIINDLCDIAYICNLRARDISHVPVFYSYLYISKEDVRLFCDDRAVTEDIQMYLSSECQNITISKTEDVYYFLSDLKDKRILADCDVINHALTHVAEKNEFVYKTVPIESIRAVKNTTEIKNIKSSHTDDAVVLTKLIYRLKNHVKDKELSEYEVSKLLSGSRKKIGDYVEDSFETIVAFGKNAAMMHYAPKKEKSEMIEKRGFLLIDSGGHYLRGTTDVTRTIAMGPLSYEEKYNYTRVLKAHLRLMDAKFQRGTSGENLDVLARDVFWQEGDDYRSGTGHGVGYLLSVHEGPNCIRPRIVKKPTPLEPGMITTDEPGYYKEGEYGIRIENELLCTKYKNTDYGEYYCFMPVTFVPYESDAIIYEMLDKRETFVLNNYNAMIRKKIALRLEKEEREWLNSVTKTVEYGR